MTNVGQATPAAATPAPRKRVLLLNPPGDELYLRDNYCSFTSKANYYWPAIDLLAQSGILSQHFDVHVRDALVEKDSPSECLAYIEALAPQFVLMVTGFASKHNDNLFLRQLKQRQPGIRVIVSGGYPFFQKAQALAENADIDATLMDYTSDGSVAYINGDYSNVVDMIYRDAGRIVETRSDPSRKFNYPPPRHELFPLPKYRIPNSKRRPFTIMLASSGCPFRCSYCVFAGVPYQHRETENIIEEMRVVRDLGIREISFIDPTFTISKKRTQALCRRMIEEKFDFTWVCLSRCDTIDETTVELMHRAGCHSIQFGVESGENAILLKHTKNLKLSEVNEAFRLCRKYKIDILAYFIIGLPGDDETSIRKTIDFAKRLNPEFASFTVATPDYGTRLRDECIENNWIAADNDNFDSTATAIIDYRTMKPERIRELHRTAVREFYLRPSYIWSQIRRVRSLADFNDKFRNFLELLRKQML